MAASFGKLGSRVLSTVSHTLVAVRQRAPDFTTAAAAVSFSMRSIAATHVAHKAPLRVFCPAKLVRGLTTAPGNAVAVPAPGVAAPAAGALPPKVVLVKVGNGEYSDIDFQWNAMSRWKRMHLLKALANSKEFGNDLKEVPLGKCTVTIVPSVASSVDGPTLMEEASALLLKLVSTVGDLAASRTTGDVLFIHVRTPTPAGLVFAGSGVTKFEHFVDTILRGNVSYWLRSIADDGIPPSPEVLAAGRGVGKLADIVAKHGWENLLALELPDGVEWPRQNLEGPLFVRDFYNHAWTDLLNGLQRGVIVRANGMRTSRASKFVVLGTPGIGKTAFTMYCLLRVLVERRPLRYRINLKDAGSTEYGYDVHVNKAGVVVGGRVPETSSKGYVFIHDSNKPDDFTASDADGSLLVTSPDPIVWKEWHKQGQAVSYYFPTHTREELRTLAWLTNTPLGRVDENIRNFGGVPRYVLDPKAAAERLIQAKSSLSELTQQQVRQIASGSLEDMPAMRHTIFHEDVDRVSLKPTGMLHIPENLEPLVMGEIFRQRLLTAANLISMLDHVPSACKFAGDMLESHVLKELAGHTFQLRQLTPAVRIRNDGGSEGVAIPAPTQLSFAKEVKCVVLKDFSGALVRHLPTSVASPDISKYVKPESKNQAAIDFVLANGMLCNVTLARSHRILVTGKSRPGLLALLTACPHLIRREGGGAYIDFLWWQLASRAPEQVAGPLVFADERSGKEESVEENMVKKTERMKKALTKPKLAAIQVGHEAVYVRQFVVAVPMTVEELHKALTESGHMQSVVNSAASITPTPATAGSDMPSA